MRTPDERVEGLIAAAVAGQLSPSERNELDRLRRQHPWIDEEIEGLAAVAARLGDRNTAPAPAWVESKVTDSLRERVLGAVPAGSGRAGLSGDRGVARTARQRAWFTPLLAAACLAVGLVVGLGVPVLTSSPPSGPPGTLGAVEALPVAQDSAGVDVGVDLVAHTWGTEAVLDVTGLRTGETYSVVFVGDDGTEFPAGEMLGSAVPIHCRLNAAVLREDARRLEIRDADAGLVAHADLPRVVG